MKKTYALIIALFALASLSAYAQKTTTLEYSRNRTYSTSTKTVNYWYQGEVNIGYAINSKIKYSGESMNTNFSQPFLSTIQGVRITKWAFAGIGVGLHYAYGYIDTDYKDYSDHWNTLLLPIFFNAKGYYPINDDLSVYVTLSFGDSPKLTSEAEACKFRYYGEYGAGLNYRKLNFSLGLQQQAMKDDDSTTKYTANSFYLKIGLMF